MGLCIMHHELSNTEEKKNIIMITIRSDEIILLVSNFRIVFLTPGRERERVLVKLSPYYQGIPNFLWTLMIIELYWKWISSYSIILTIAFDSLFSDTSKLLPFLIDLDVL